MYRIDLTPPNTHIFMANLDKALAQLIQKASNLEKNRNFKAALITYQKCLAANPDVANRKHIYKRQIKISLHSGDIQQAEEFSLTAMQRFPSIVHFHLQYIVCAINAKEFSTALERVNESLQFFPQNEWILLHSANTKVALGDYEEAEKDFELLLDNHPDFLNGLIAYANLAVEKERWKEAICRWQNIQIKFPNKIIAYLRLSSIYKRLGDTKEAILLMEKATEKFPDDHRPFFQLGQLWSIQGPGYEEQAIKCYETVCKINPSADILFKLGTLHSTIGRSENAKQCYGQINDKYPESTLGILGLIDLELKNSRTQSAKLKLQDGLEKWPRDLHLNVANLNILLSEKKKSIFLSELGKVKRWFPDNLQTKLLEARYYLKQLEYKKAAAIYSIILAKHPLHQNASLHHLNCVLQMGQLEKAEKIAIELSQHSSFLGNAHFLTLCARIIPVESVELWEKLANSFLNSNITSPISINKYLTILEDLDLAPKALSFLNKVIENTKQVSNLNILPFLLFEKQRIQNSIILTEEEDTSKAESSFKRIEDDIADDLKEIVYNSTNTLAIAWYDKNQRLLGEIRKNYSHHLSTGLIPIEALRIAELVISAIKNTKPFSMIRLGDGEGNFIPYESPYVSYQKQDQLDIQTLWWGKQLLVADDDEMIQNRFLAAIDKACLLYTSPSPRDRG